MNDDKLVQLAEKAIEESFKLFNDMLSVLFRPGGVEIGYLLRDKVQYWRLKSAVNTWEKTKKLFEKKGIKIENLSPVAPKILYPLIENCSLEDDEYMQDKWAALLANAADPETAKDVKPVYVEILKQITPIEAKLLDYLLDLTISKHKWCDDNNSIRSFPSFSKYAIQHKKFLDEILNIISKEEYESIVDNLLRLKICEPQEEKQALEIREHLYTPKKRYKMSSFERSDIHFTHLGFNFVKACRYS